MKIKVFLTVTALFFTISAIGQKPTIELTFTAENNGQYVPLDSILIENLTQSGDTTLYAPDTVLVLDYITSISNNVTNGEKTLSVSQNYPNPFKGKTEVKLYLPEKEQINITVRDILGRELINYENTLNGGNHTFTFYSGSEKYYFLSVTGKQTSKTIKMLNANINTNYEEKLKIVYSEFADNTTGLKSQRLRKVDSALAEKAINNFEFSIGDELKYTCYSAIGERTITGSPTGSQTYTFQYAIGEPCPGMPTVTDIEGNTYNTVQISTQCWMKENLKTTTYQNGTLIPNVTYHLNWGILTTGAYVWYENDEIEWKDKYGALYNWYAVVDTNGLCPTGWHVPTNDEWTDLTDYIGGTGSPYGNELKSCRQVNSPLGGGCNTSEHPRWDESNTFYGTDDYGFSGLPGGNRNFDGYFNLIGWVGYWWSSTEYSLSNAWGRGLVYYAGNVHMPYDYKLNGYSVRCLRD